LRADSPLFASRARPRSPARTALLKLAAAALALAAVATLVGLAFAGSRHDLAEGTRIAGVDVGGLTERQASDRLEQLFAGVAATPVTFTAAGESFRFAANQLGIEPDWRSAAEAAAHDGGGFGPVRGFRRLHTRVFGAEVFPPLAVSNGALEFALGRIARSVDQEPTSAALVRHGLKIETVEERAGARLDRTKAAEIVVRALGSADRGPTPVRLPVAIAEPPVTVAMLADAAERARFALSASVRLSGAGRSWRVPRWRIAQLLSLPSDGTRRLSLAGADAEAYFRSLAKRVDRAPVDAGFAASGDAVRIMPSREGLVLDVPATARALLRAAISENRRVARLTVSRAAPERTTAEATAMGITELLGTYKTYNAGTWDRITNLRLGVTALDGTLVEPGGTFSLNEAIGERTAERGFRPAPVIIGTKYAEEIGGGTSQVATTVFNTAWEAGLRITERNPHALYIDRYPLGRDATVYWPSLDLKFQNDTKNWILVKGFPESDGIRVSIYGGEQRRVESSPGTMTVTGPVPVKRVKDRKLLKGKTEVEEEGSAPSRTSVTRTVYGAEGELIRTETWNTSYKGEIRIVRVGTKPKKPAEKPGDSPESTAPPSGDRATPGSPQP
jgi:vancomycin resistance protein YoaR